jgi:hypothetical protein
MATGRPDPWWSDTKFTDPEWVALAAEFDIFDVVPIPALCPPSRGDLGLGSWISPRSEIRHDSPQVGATMGLGSWTSPRSEIRHDALRPSRPRASELDLSEVSKPA